MDKSAEGRSVGRRVDDHLREGLYLMAVGRVLEGRREWRRALALAPAHPVALDYLISTDDELSTAEQRQEQEEIEMSAPGAVLDVSETSDVWAGEPEVTGEAVEGQWSRGTSASPDDHVRVSAPGSSAHPLKPPPGPAAVVEMGSWDGEDTPVRSRPRGSTPPRSRVSRDTHKAAEPAQESIDSLLAQVAQALKGGEYATARKALEEVLQREPRSAAGLEHQRKIQDHYKRLFTGDVVPERTMDLDELSHISLDQIGGYVVSMIDGQTTVEDIYTMTSHVEPSRVLRILSLLHEQGAIKLRR